MSSRWEHHHAACLLRVISSPKKILFKVNNYLLQLIIVILHLRLKGLLQIALLIFVDDRCVEMVDNFCNIVLRNITHYYMYIHSNLFDLYFMILCHEKKVVNIKSQNNFRNIYTYAKQTCYYVYYVNMLIKVSSIFTW